MHVAARMNINYALEVFARLGLGPFPGVQIYSVKWVEAYLVQAF